MIKRLSLRLYHAVIKFYEAIKYYFVWYGVQTIMPIKSLELGKYGGSNVLVDDLNLDGQNELIVLQNAGMFKSKYYDGVADVKNYKDKAKQEDVFSLSCLNMDGVPLWTIGKPWDQAMPYLCHGHEQIIKLADINDDGYKEILTFDARDNLLIINHKGEIIHTIQLPNDNFSIIYHVPIPGKDFILVIGTMDRAYDPHPYANPWLILNSNFEIISNKDYIGAGHNIVVDDVNGDGVPEIMIGYQLVDINGNVLWTLDFWQDQDIDSVEQHADNIASFWKDGEWFAAISGSDKQYLINAQGQTVWVKTLPHPQYSLIGQYKGETRIFVANQREIMNSINIDGEECWHGLLPEYWCKGIKPKLIDKKRPIHVNNPLIKFKDKEDYDIILYTEGGIPYLVDFNGKLLRKFTIDIAFCLFSWSQYYRRINDIGVNFDGIVVENRIYLFNRKYLLIYEP